MSRGEEAAQILLRRTHAKRAGFHMGDNEFELTGGGGGHFVFHTAHAMSYRSCPPAHGWCHIRDEPIVLRSSSLVCCQAKLIRRHYRLFFFLIHSHLDLQGRVFTAESGKESGTVKASSPQDAHTHVILGPSSNQVPHFYTQPPPAPAINSSLASYFQGYLKNRQSS